ncbi:MAG TPA: hypothetical protein PKE49_11170 [Leptospiraceae bacterium]|jgi:hypothetical protein|nr:hypothetical protein [Leptospirales bacterium]HMU85809.1 hypothetical protein [Leptospiraceae bacterium]HMW58644.1 hypothetical protein [Leptospiraceae bacterium]HMX57075.1 hypothetical protein [Leptospiraceae bacterium]HMY45253.1 hypothetical protein [Leptospiraceae bacterium]
MKRGGIFQLLLVLAVFLVPFGVVHFYTRNIVSASLLRRDIHLAGLKKEQLVKKNMALKEALGRLTGRDLVLPSEGLPFSENNRIVRLRMSRDSEAAETRSVPDQPALN